MAKDIFDTCILINRQEQAFVKVSLMSAIVLQELTAGASNNKEVKVFEGLRRNFENNGVLIVPNGEDWFLF